MLIRTYEHVWELDEPRCLGTQIRCVVVLEHTFVFVAHSVWLAQVSMNNYEFHIFVLCSRLVSIWIGKMQIASPGIDISEIGLYFPKLHFQKHKSVQATSHN